MRAGRDSRAGKSLIGAFALLLALIVVIGPTGSAAAGKTKGSKPPVRPTYAPAVATGAFGLDLLRAMPPGNAVVSPDSIAVALAMTGRGGVGPTATEIARTLRLKGPSAFAAVGDLQQAILAGQTSAAVGDSAPPTLQIANRLYLQQGFPLKKKFVRDTRKHFGARLDAVDFEGDPVAASDTINRWISNQTRGLIPKIVSKESVRGLVLALANAIYLDAGWLHPFKPYETEFGTFQTTAGKVPARFMHQSELLGYGAGPGYRAVALPYRSSTLSLMVMLPVRQRVEQLQKRLNGKKLARIAANLSPRQVNLSLPRFHVRTDVELKNHLIRLGMPTAFSGGMANFSRITTAAPMVIDFVRHVADLTVGEKGTVAAAATVVGARPVSARPTKANSIPFDVDRPFLFFLRDDRSGAVLFAGRVTEPLTPEP